jgi:hypothetical protein
MLHRMKIRTLAFVVAASIVVAAPAGADLAVKPGTASAIAVPSPGGEGVATWAAAAAGADAAHGAACDGCSAVLDEVPGRSATRSVNLAILVLGSLWLTLMVRRIQMRAGEDGLRGGARPHAAGGH